MSEIKWTDAQQAAINVKANKPTSLCNKQIALDFIDGKLHAGLWNKLMKRDFVNNNNIRFPEESYYEDMHFTISSLMNGCRVTYLDKATYHYVINTNSLTFNVDIYKRIESFKEFANNIQNLCLQFNFYEDNDFAFSINKLINSNKKSFISKFYKNKNKINEILNYIPSYFNYCDIKSFFDFAYYIALKYDIYLLFHIHRIIKSIKLVSKR